MLFYKWTQVNNPLHHMFVDEFCQLYVVCTNVHCTMCIQLLVVDGVNGVLELDLNVSVQVFISEVFNRVIISFADSPFWTQSTQPRVYFTQTYLRFSSVLRAEVLNWFDLKMLTFNLFFIPTNSFPSSKNNSSMVYFRVLVLFIWWEYIVYFRVLVLFIWWEYIVYFRFLVLFIWWEYIVY